MLNAGKDGATPAAVIESGTLPAQRVLEGTLATIADLAQAHAIHAPALLVVGSVVERRGELTWYESLPLFGQRIVVTRPIDEAVRIAPELESLGAEVLLAPSVRILPIADTAPLDEAIGRLAEFDWVVFTSGNGVRFFVGATHEPGQGPAGDRAPEAGSDWTGYRADAGAVIICGPILFPTPIAQRPSPRRFQLRAAGRRILLARADRGRALLNEELANVADIHQVAVYQNADAEALPELVVRRIESGTVDWITLTSSAIATRLHALLPESARKPGRSSGQDSHA